MVDGRDLGSRVERRRGSSPLSLTIVAAELMFGGQGEVGKGRTSQYGIGGDSVHLYFAKSTYSFMRKYNKGVITMFNTMIIFTVCAIAAMLMGLVLNAAFVAEQYDISFEEALECDMAMVVPKNCVIVTSVDFDEEEA